jgi:hypothetical protein
MNMVFNAIDPQQFAIIVFDNSPNIFVEFLGMLFWYTWASVFCTEHYLIIDLFVAHYVGSDYLSIPPPIASEVTQI